MMNTFRSDQMILVPQLQNKCFIQVIYGVSLMCFIKVIYGLSLMTACQSSEHVQFCVHVFCLDICVVNS